MHLNEVDFFIRFGLISRSAGDKISSREDSAFTGEDGACVCGRNPNRLNVSVALNGEKARVKESLELTNGEKVRIVGLGSEFVSLKGL
jgi:hypothetical protein